MNRGPARRLLTACLSLAAVTALAATAQAQDTTQAGAAPMPQDSAPTGQAQGDTLGGDRTRLGHPADSTARETPQGYQGMEPSADSLDSLKADSAVDSGTAPGEQAPRQPAKPEERPPSDSAAPADTTSP